MSLTKLNFSFEIAVALLNLFSSFTTSPFVAIKLSATIISPSIKLDVERSIPLTVKPIFSNFASKSNPLSSASSIGKII